MRGAIFLVAILGVSVSAVEARAGAMASGGGAIFQGTDACGGQSTTFNVTRTGTPSVTGAITASTSVTNSLTGIIHDSEAGDLPFGVFATGGASADLASGTLKAAAFSSPGFTLTPTQSCAPSPFFATASAAASIQDVLHLTIPKALQADNVFLTMTMAIDGKLSTSLPLGIANLELVSDLSGQVPHATYLRGTGVTNNQTASITDTIEIHAAGSSLSTDAVTVIAQLLLDRANPSAFGLPGDGPNAISFGNFADYSDTGQLGLVVPDGVTFTSDSGVFLTSSAAESVPEPRTLTLFASGLAGCILVRRPARKRRKTNDSIQ